MHTCLYDVGPEQVNVFHLDFTKGYSMRVQRYYTVDLLANAGVAVNGCMRDGNAYATSEGFFLPFLHFSVFLLQYLTETPVIIRLLDGIVYVTMMKDWIDNALSDPTCAALRYLIINNTHVVANMNRNTRFDPSCFSEDNEDLLINAIAPFTIVATAESIFYFIHLCFDLGRKLWDRRFTIDLQQNALQIRDAINRVLPYFQVNLTYQTLQNYRQKGTFQKYISFRTESIIKSLIIYSEILTNDDSTPYVAFILTFEYELSKDTGLTRTHFCNTVLERLTNGKRYDLLDWRY